MNLPVGPSTNNPDGEPAATAREGTIMAGAEGVSNEVRAHRVRLGWSQGDLAARAGLSRTGIGAIEAGRLVPSTAAALALAAALGCRVEDLFRLRRLGVADAGGGPDWAWAPRAGSGRFWRAEVGGRSLLYPVEASPLGVIPADGTFAEGPDSTLATDPDRPDPARTLVVACCDPAVGLLAGELAGAAGVRLVALVRPSRAALALLGAGLVHAAGVHLADLDGGGNALAAREAVGAGAWLLRVAEWEEGVAVAPGAGLGTVEAAVRSPRWVGREAGSGARRQQDALLGDRPEPGRRAGDHRGVAEAIRSGWADAGVCLRLAAEEAGLDFLGVAREAYDLALPAALRDDPRGRALVAAVRSASYRRHLGELPGYDAARAGELGPA